MDSILSLVVMLKYTTVGTRSYHSRPHHKAVFYHTTVGMGVYWLIITESLVVMLRHGDGHDAIMSDLEFTKMDALILQINPLEMLLIETIL